MLRFDPVVHPLPCLTWRPWRARQREPSYAAARGGAAVQGDPRQESITESAGRAWIRHVSVAVQAVLRTLARLSAAEQPQRLQLDLTKTAGLAWMGNNAAGWTVLMQDPNRSTTAMWTPAGQMRPAVRRLAGFDALHREDRLLRLGWAVVRGPAAGKGQRRAVVPRVAAAPGRARGGRGATPRLVVADSAGGRAAGLVVPARTRIHPGRRGSHPTSAAAGWCRRTSVARRRTAIRAPHGSR